MGAPVVWFEIAGRDLDALGRFYGDLLGWKLDADNPVRYGSVETGGEGGIKGGIWAPGEPVGEYVSFYASVEDLDATLGGRESLDEADGDSHTGSLVSVGQGQEHRP